MMNPDPPAPDFWRLLRELRFHLRPRYRPVPPRTDGHERARQFQAVAVNEQSFRPRFLNPSRHGLIRRAAGIAVVIARTDQQPRFLPDATQILFHHDNLHIEIQAGTQVQQVAADDDGIVVRRIGDQPVELLERIMEVGDEQHLHTSPRIMRQPIQRVHAQTWPPRIVKLNAPNTADEKIEDVVKSAQDAAVLVLVY